MRDIMRSGAYSTLRLPWILAICAGLAVPGSPAAGEGSQCARPELEWDNWLDDASTRNPGLMHYVLTGPERDELLRAYSCLEPGETCPPDRVEVLYCMGNSQVLLAFVKNGCVTMAEDMPIEDFMGFTRGGTPC